jgi:hypothetical protein
MPAAKVRSAIQRSGERQCTHWPGCPSAAAPDRTGARTIARHPEQGWSLLCNGVVIFDDGGALLPGGQATSPRDLPGFSMPPRRPQAEHSDRGKARAGHDRLRCRPTEGKQRPGVKNRVYTRHLLKVRQPQFDAMESTLQRLLHARGPAGCGSPHRRRHS